MKFKKLHDTDETLALENGYVSNLKHWIFKINWLEAQENRGNIQLRNRVKALVVNTVTTRLTGNGDAAKTAPISAILCHFNAVEFKPVSVADSTPVQGYYKGMPDRLETVAYRLGCITLDAEFFCALRWDSETVAHIRGPKDPVFVTNKAGEIVFVAVPLNPVDVKEGMNL
jgi:hypothetical protein